MAAVTLAERPNQQSQPTLKAKPRPTPLSSLSLESIVRDIWNDDEDILSGAVIDAPTNVTISLPKPASTTLEVETSDPESVLFNKIRKCSIDYRGQVGKQKIGRPRSATTTKASVSNMEARPSKLISMLSLSSIASPETPKSRPRSQTCGSKPSLILVESKKANKLMAKSSTSSTSSVGSKISLKDSKFIVNVKKKIKSFSSETFYKRNKLSSGTSADSSLRNSSSLLAPTDAGCDLVHNSEATIPRDSVIEAAVPRDSVQATMPQKSILGTPIHQDCILVKKQNDQRDDVVGPTIDIGVCS
ncbi:hypothetical protein SARC_06951 [Sphaeroforma arctica JP610]|uniref:Uncharacterized protein n=1 Tax=Sphaeroforma arctica JP610 TaxID=667725 RepID=A0A0L0FV48_9EUKA|nr:hypothetical protein SARC_06951 [Sphaeroforma arctica JP610]KNC80702.1 hypothetical protein SARC_06951 [Sphaeroforma arctica JP610]|eukprot:XP_014154604.1 hypothetical protein SARC_06951 [Sphaeroforma arctica JP610]